MLVGCDELLGALDAEDPYTGFHTVVGLGPFENKETELLLEDSEEAALVLEG